MKTCTACKEEKTLDEFPADSSKPSGRKSRCRICENAAKRLSKKRRNNIKKLQVAKNSVSVDYPQTTLPIRCDPDSIEMRRRRAAAEALYM